MLFLLDYEPEFDFVTQDSIIVKQQLDKLYNMHSYVIMCNEDFYHSNGRIKNKSDFPIEYATAIPVGSIQFTSSFLDIFHGIKREFALEIPEVLRKEQFLKRYYQIIPASELPHQGVFFIKDVSEQRSFSYVGEIAELHMSKGSPIDPTHYYQISEKVTVSAEYRVYVIDGVIKNISFYSGIPTVFPDIKVIESAVNEYSKSNDCLRSFSMDFMVTPNGTAIIEMHTYLSLGMYWTKWDESLLQGYIDSMKYVIRMSKKNYIHEGL